MSAITISELSHNSYISEITDGELKKVVGGELGEPWGVISQQLAGVEEPPEGMSSALIFMGLGDEPVDVLFIFWERNVKGWTGSPFLDLIAAVCIVRYPRGGRGRCAHAGGWGDAPTRGVGAMRPRGG